jgi:CRP-like cAMP-binding protein
LFSGIQARLLQNLGLMFRTVFLRAGQILFEELDEGKSLFIVSSGECEAFVTHTSADGTSGSSSSSEKVLKRFVKADLLGEVAVLMSVPRTASVRAVTDCWLLELQKDNFRRFVRLVPSTGNIHAVMKSRTAEHFRRYRVPFFAAIPDDKYIVLASLCKIEQFMPGDVVFREGECGRCFYIIAHGELKVTVKAPPQPQPQPQTPTGGHEQGIELKQLPATSRGRGSISSPAGGAGPGVGGGLLLPSPNTTSIRRGSVMSVANTEASPSAGVVDPITGEVELTRMGPGRYFGEIALVQDSVRTATVTCVKRSVVLSISQENFQTFFAAAPEAIADFEVKLARYDVRLRSVLYHPIGLQFFQEHLQREYALENIEFWKELRDFRHLSLADVPTPKNEAEAQAQELDREIEEDMRKAQEQQAAGASAQLNSSSSSPNNHARARRQSLVRIQNADVAATFDLFADSTAAAATAAASAAAATSSSMVVAPVPPPSRAAAPSMRASFGTRSSQGGVVADEPVMTLGALVSLLSFFELPLPSLEPDRSLVLNEMAEQLGYDVVSAGGLGRPYIRREYFVAVLSGLERGHFPECVRKIGVVHPALEQVQLQEHLERVTHRSGEWGAQDGPMHTKDPTSDYLPPDLSSNGGGGGVNGVGLDGVAAMSSVSSPSLASESPRNLSLASKLLLKLTRLILDLRVGKLKATFALYDADGSGSIELGEFEAICRTLKVAGCEGGGGGTGGNGTGGGSGGGEAAAAAAAAASGTGGSKAAGGNGVGGLGGDQSSRIVQAFQSVDSDNSGSLSLLEFVHWFFREKKNNRALQALLESRARAIYDIYICDAAPKQVNLRSHVQKKLQMIMEGTTSSSASPAASGAPVSPSSPGSTKPTAAVFKLPVTAGAAAVAAAAAALTAASGTSASPSSVTSPTAPRPKVTQSMFDEAEAEILALLGQRLCFIAPWLCTALFFCLRTFASLTAVLFVVAWTLLLFFQVLIPSRVSSSANCSSSSFSPQVPIRSRDPRTSSRRRRRRRPTRPQRVLAARDRRRGTPSSRHIRACSLRSPNILRLLLLHLLAVPLLRARAPMDLHPPLQLLPLCLPLSLSAAMTTVLLPR